MLSDKDIVRFWSKVNKTETCWLWTPPPTVYGYGQFSVSSGGGKYKMVRAHRVAWSLLRGPIPAGLVPDHLCRVRHCVNPDHIELVTSKVNILRGVSVSAGFAKQTHCKRGHELSGDNLYLHNDIRRCRICERMHRRKWKARKRLEAIIEQK